MCIRALCRSPGYRTLYIGALCVELYIYIYMGHIDALWVKLGVKLGPAVHCCPCAFTPLSTPTELKHLSQIVCHLLVCQPDKWVAQQRGRQPDKWVAQHRGDTIE